MQRRPTRRRFAVFAVVLGVVLPLLLLEGGLRVWHARRGTYAVSDESRRLAEGSPFRASADPELIYEHRRDPEVRRVLRMESHGLLQPEEVSLDKRMGSLRIALVGDSVGAAMHLIHTQRMAYFMEHQLAVDLRRDVEVLNFCVTGYDTLQEARVIESVVPQFQPDLVVLVYCLNDPAVSQTPREWYRPPDAPASYVFAAAQRVFGLGDSRPYATAAGPADPVARPLWDRMYDAEGQGSRAVERGLDRIAQWSTATKTPVLIAIAPLILPTDPGGVSTATYRAKVAAAALDRGLPSIDLQPAFDGVPMPALVYNQDDIYHADVAGQEAMSRALTPFVASFAPPPSRK